jgi:hypothetical protein
VFRFIPTTEERSVSSKRGARAQTATSPVNIVEENLPTKAELLQQLSMDLDQAQESSHIQFRENNRSPVADIVPCVNNNPLRSSHLWSKKSLDMFRRMKSYTDSKASSMPFYDNFALYNRGDIMGVVDTYYACNNGERIEHTYSDWSFYKARFEINKVQNMLFQSNLIVLFLR